MDWLACLASAGILGAMAAASYIAWFRPAVLRALVRSALLASVAVCSGMSLVAWSLWHRHAHVALGLAIPGGILAVAGPLGMMLRWHRILWTHDWLIGVRTDGLEVRLPGVDRLYAWDDLASVSARPPHLRLALRDGAETLIPGAYAGHRLEAVVKIIETTRRRASMGLRLTNPT
jgi:hypothetical protein